MSYPNHEVTSTQRGVGRLALLAVVLALIGNVVVFAYLRPYGILRELSPLAEAREHIHTRFVGEVEDQELIDAALRGMAGALGDENTQYFSAEELSAFNEHVGGSFTGIGAEIDIHKNRLRIVAPLDNSPAWNAGVMPGDIVLEIEGQDTLGIDIFDAMRQLKGEAGTDVTIRVRHRTGEEETITITRKIIQVASVRGYKRNPGNGFDYMIDPQRKIAYLRLTQFGETSLEEVEDKLSELKKQGMKALILDLRNNGGGLLDGAAGISDIFLTGGKTIVSTKGKGTISETIKSTDNTLLPDLPLVVLINGNSASASEIVAGAMLDNDRALLVGSRSFGKGSVQQLLPLADGTSAIKLTTAYWYMPSGKMIHRKKDATEWGVDPSPGNFVPVDDEQLRAMLIKRREAEVDDPYAKLDGPVTPQWLRNEMLDDPMAAALEAAQQLLTKDGWPKVGVDQEAALAEPTDREALETRKQELLELLEEVNGKIEDLDTDEDQASP
ncbi:MAG: S41 family peptidase [Phycisphaeraceae bacterium]